MTTDIHTRVMLENWGFLAQTGQWEILEKAVDLYLEQNPPLIYPAESRAAGIDEAPGVALQPKPLSDLGAISNGIPSNIQAVARKPHAGSDSQHHSRPK